MILIILEKSFILLLALNIFRNVTFFTFFFESNTFNKA